MLLSVTTQSPQAGRQQVRYRNAPAPVQRGAWQGPAGKRILRSAAVPHSLAEAAADHEGGAIPAAGAGAIRALQLVVDRWGHSAGLQSQDLCSLHSVSTASPTPSRQRMLMDAEGSLSSPGERSSLGRCQSQAQCCRCR